jgi:type I restriction enzyme, S subunit
MSMTDWDEVRIEDLGDIIAGGTPSRGNPSYWNGRIPWVTPSEITELRDKYLRETRERITAEGLAGSAAKLLPPGSVLVTTRATLGEEAIAAVPVATNQGFKSIIPNTDSHSLFAYYLVCSLKLEMERLASGTTFLEISKADFSRIKVRRPKHDEQTRIAAVLDTVDEAIAKKEAVIAKLQQVRAGLLHDLLSRGLDEHGQLRDPIAHPGQFQDSPLGKIPRAWEVKTCQSICREIVVGIVVKPAQYYVEEGVPVLRSANVREEGIQMSDLVFISDESNTLLSKSILRTGDVVTVRTGYPGTSCVVPSHLDGANCVDLIILRPSAEIVPAFLALWTNSPFGRNQILKAQGGLAQQHFNVGELKTLLTAKPERDEQVRIVERIAMLGSRISLEVETGAKLSQLKSGLMADLLTGRVRVPESISVVENQS